MPLSEQQVRAIIAYKNYGLKMGAHCEREHGGLIAVNVSCNTCGILVGNLDSLWGEIAGDEPQPVLGS